MFDYEGAARELKEADCVLIGAGAGMSAAAGLDYLDEISFAERFPGMLQYGITYQYQLMGYPFPSEALKWGYFSVALDYVYNAGKKTVYQDLKSLIGDKDYFVITSNVDRYFHKNGFEESRIYTPQGDYENFQCLGPCKQEVWDGTGQIKSMLPTINRETQMVEDETLLPTCPSCGGPIFMNVRGGGWFVETPYLEKQQTFYKWLKATLDKRLAIIEIGSGFNTPGVIRLPLESLSLQHPRARLIRINRDYPQSPEGAISIAAPADLALKAIVKQANLQAAEQTTT